MIRARYREEIAGALAAWCGRPVRWGVDDCAMSIANIDRAVLGADSGAGVRGRYRSEAGARRVFGRRGLACFIGGVAKRLQWKRIMRKNIAAASDGDRGLALTPAGLTCVIRYCGVWIARFDRGDQRACDGQIVRAWSVI